MDCKGPSVIEASLCECESDNLPPSPCYLDIFDDAVSVDPQRVYCQQISSVEYEAQRDLDTYTSLQLLIQYMEYHPEVYQRVVRQRKLEEMESHNLMSYMKYKVMSTLGGGHFLKSLVPDEECTMELLKLKYDIQRAFNYAQELRSESSMRSTGSSREKRVPGPTNRAAAAGSRSRRVWFSGIPATTSTNKFQGVQHAAATAIAGGAELKRSPIKAAAKRSNSKAAAGGAGISKKQRVGAGGVRLGRLGRRPLRDIANTTDPHANQASTPSTGGARTHMGVSSLCATPASLRHIDTSLLHSSLIETLDDKLRGLSQAQAQSPATPQPTLV